MHFDFLNRLGVDDESNRQTDGQTERALVLAVVGSLDVPYTF